MRGVMILRAHSTANQDSLSDQALVYLCTKSEIGTITPCITICATNHAMSSRTRSPVLIQSSGLSKTAILN